MVLEPPLLDAPAEEQAAVSAPRAASAAAARSGRDGWAKRIVQSSPAVGENLSTLFRWRCQTTHCPKPHFARETAQFAPDNCPDVRFDVQDVEQSGMGDGGRAGLARGTRRIACLVGQAVGAAEVDHTERLAHRALAGAEATGAGVDPTVTPVDHARAQADTATTRA